MSSNSKSSGFTPLEIAKSHGQDKMYGKKLEQRKSLTGFTLLEVLIVMTLLATLGATATGYYRNYAKNVEFQNAAKTVIFDLKRMQGRAVAGQDQLKWGVRLVNGTPDDYYETFSTPTTYADAAKVVEETIYLPSTVVFTTPAEGGASVTLNWTNSASSDFSNVVILRKASSAVTDAPAEGSSPAVNDPIGTSTVVHTGTGITFIDTGVSGGTSYHYKIFSKDTNGNYDAGVVPTGSPFTP